MRILKSSIFQFILVFVAIFVAFYFYGDSKLPYFTDPDSLYHVGMAKYMIKNGLIIHHFPYLNFTNLNKNFVDWHFLFHLVLIPFIKIFGEINGPKILGISLLAGTFGIIYLIFKEKKLKLAWLYTLILFFLMPAAFYFRMTFIRASVLSLFLIILSIFLLIKNKPVYIGILIFVYVYSYYGSIVIFIPFLVYLIIQIIKKEKINYQILIWTLVGFVAGIVINPYFPKNIHIFYLQLIAAAQNNRLYAGAEWLDQGTWDWFYDSMMVILLFFSGIIITMLKNIKQDSQILAILLFSLALLIMQWKSVRFIEYWPVIGGLTGFLLIGPYIERVVLSFRKNWKTIEVWFMIILVTVFIQEGIFHGIWEYWGLKKIIPKYTPIIEQLQTVGTFLKDNSNQGDVVFARWDFFPELFYFNQKNYYIVGLDPIFLEDYNKELFDKYIDLTMNNKSNLTEKIIKDDFHAKWVVVDPTMPSLNEKLQKNTDSFQQVFAYNGIVVFKVL